MSYARLGLAVLVMAAALSGANCVSPPPSSCGSPPDSQRAPTELDLARAIQEHLDSEPSKYHPAPYAGANPAWEPVSGPWGATVYLRGEQIPRSECAWLYRVVRLERGTDAALDLEDPPFTYDLGFLDGEVQFVRMSNPPEALRTSPHGRHAGKEFVGGLFGTLFGVVFGVAGGLSK